jgi:hypothetical protein
MGTRILYRACAEMTTTLKSDKVWQEFSGHYHPGFRVQTEYLLDESKELHKKLFPEKKRKGLITTVTVVTKEII